MADRVRKGIASLLGAPSGMTLCRSIAGLDRKEEFLTRAKFPMQQTTLRRVISPGKSQTIANLVATLVATGHRGTEAGFPASIHARSRRASQTPFLRSSHLQPGSQRVGDNTSLWRLTCRLSSTIMTACHDATLAENGCPPFAVRPD